MSGEERRGSQSRDFARVSEARRQLYEAVTAHKVDLEITRGFADLEMEELDRRIEASQRLLDWLEQAPELPSDVSTGLKHLSRPRRRAPANVVFADFLSRSAAKRSSS